MECITYRMPFLIVSREHCTLGQALHLTTRATWSVVRVLDWMHYPRAGSESLCSRTQQASLLSAEVA